MPQLTQRGLVDTVGATESRQYKDKTFYSRTLILEQPRYDQYSGEKLGSNFIKFEATREDACKLLDSFPAGSKVDVEFIVRGTKYAKKDGSGDDVFTHLEIRDVRLASGAAPASAPAGASAIPSAIPPAQPASPAAPAQVSDYDEDLGF